MKSILAIVIVVPICLAACSPATSKQTYDPKIEKPLDVSKNCVDKIARDICPPGTSLDMNASNEATCGGELGVAVRNVEGKISGVCGKKDGCVFTCKIFPNMCQPYGIHEISLQKVTCNPPEPCPRCQTRSSSSGECISPAPCTGKCERFNDATCRCESLNQGCSSCQRWDDGTCGCVRAHSVTNCGEQKNCLTYNDDRSCMGMAHAAQNAGCWNGPTACN